MVAAPDVEAPRDGGDGKDGPDDRTAPHRSAPDRSTGTGPPLSERAADPRAVRVRLAAAFGHVGLPPVIMEPLPTPTNGASVVIDGDPADARLEHLDPDRVVLHAGRGSGPVRVVLEPAEAAVDGRGVLRREVVVDGWRIELEIESERRAALRDRARRGREESAHGGPTEVHAIIPGRIVSVSVAPGDAVVASEQLLVVEAMKMQNELRAPRDGTVTTVGVAPGDTIEIGDLLLVLE